MPTFSRYPIEPETSGQTVWTKIRDLLLTMKSVEVVLTSTGESERFELRAWDGVRADDSNGPNATPGNDY